MSKSKNSLPTTIRLLPKNKTEMELMVKDTGLSASIIINVLLAHSIAMIHGEPRSPGELLTWYKSMKEVERLRGEYEGKIRTLKKTAEGLK